MLWHLEKSRAKFVFCLALWTRLS